MKKKIKKRLFKISMFTFCFSSVIGLNGCDKVTPCNETELHVHKYVDEDGFVRYLASESGKYRGFKKTDEVIIITEEKDLELYKYLAKEGLLRVEDNLDLIKQMEDKNKDYLMYQYKKRVVGYKGRVNIQYKWTTNQDHPHLTGKERIMHYVCDAYSIEQKENGKFKKNKVEDVENIESVMDEYPYIKKDFYKAIIKEQGKSLTLKKE